MTKKGAGELILNMVNFYSLFNVEFIDLIPDLTNTEITPLLSKILNFIHFEGTTTASRISKKLNISVPNTSRSINSLYNLGYLIKKQDEKDKRIVYLSLSNKALNIILSVAATGEDILILGSGNTVHNLRLVDFDSTTIDSWSKEFDDWLIDKIENKDLNALNNYKKYAPHANLAVPTADHLVPLFIALGSSSELTPRVIFRDYQLGNLSYLCYEF